MRKIWVTLSLAAVLVVLGAGLVLLIPLFLLPSAFATVVAVGLGLIRPITRSDAWDRFLVWGLRATAAAPLVAGLAVLVWILARPGPTILAIDSDDAPVQVLAWLVFLPPALAGVTSCSLILARRGGRPDLRRIGVTTAAAAVLAAILLGFALTVGTSRESAWFLFAMVPATFVVHGYGQTVYRLYVPASRERTDAGVDAWSDLRMG